MSGNDFWTFGNGNGNGSAHSQTLGTGTGMKNCIPNFWEREWKFHSQFLGMGTGIEIPFPNFGNGNETFLFPGITGNGNGNGIVELSEHFLNTTYIILHCNRPQMWWIPQQICSNIVKACGYTLTMWKLFLEFNALQELPWITLMMLLRLEQMLWHSGFGLGEHCKVGVNLLWLIAT